MSKINNKYLRLTLLFRSQYSKIIGIAIISIKYFPVSYYGPVLIVCQTKE